MNNKCTLDIKYLDGDSENFRLNVDMSRIRIEQHGGDSYTLYKDDRFYAAFNFVRRLSLEEDYT